MPDARGTATGAFCARTTEKNLPNDGFFSSTRRDKRERELHICPPSTPSPRHHRSFQDQLKRAPRLGRLELVLVAVVELLDEGVVLDELAEHVLERRQV